MTTPSFRDWAVMYGKCRARMEYAVTSLSEYRWMHTSNYILTRIERKEKALREELAMAYGEIEALAHTIAHIEVKP